MTSTIHAASEECIAVWQQQPVVTISLVCALCAAIGSCWWMQHTRLGRVPTACRSLSSLSVAKTLCLYSGMGTITGACTGWAPCSPPPQTKLQLLLMLQLQAILSIKAALSAETIMHTVGNGKHAHF